MSEIMTAWQHIWDLLSGGGMAVAVIGGFYMILRRKMSRIDNAVQKDDCAECKGEILDVRHEYFDRLNAMSASLSRVEGKLDVTIEWIRAQEKER